MDRSRTGWHFISADRSSENVERIELSDEERQLIDELQEIGAGTTVELAVRLIRKPDQTKADLDKLREAGIVTSQRYADGEEIYTVSSDARRTPTY